MVWSKEREAFSNYVVRKRDCIRSTLCVFFFFCGVSLFVWMANVATWQHAAKWLITILLEFESVLKSFLTIR